MAGNRRSHLYAAQRPVSDYENDDISEGPQGPLTLGDYVAMFNPKPFFRQRNISAAAWVLLIVLIFAIVVVLFVLAAPWWGKTREVRGFDGVFEGDMYGYYGLWFACWTLTENDNDYENARPDCELIADLRFIPDWFQGCQAMAVLMLISGVAAISANCVYICSKTYNRRPSVIASVIIFCFAAGICSVVLFVVFCVEFLKDTYWCCASGTMQIVEHNLYICFVVACTLPAIYLTAAGVAALEVMALRKEANKERYLQRVASTRRPNMGGGYTGPYQPYAPSVSSKY